MRHCVRNHRQQTTETMTIETTPIQDLVIINPTVFEDARGYFFEAYNQNALAAEGVNIQFVQDNQSYSSKGVLRGLHYQTGEHAQAKLVRVLQGEVLDVVVDIRPDSKTYGESFSVVLSGENQKQFFIPRGFAHGFLVLSETATFFYKCDNFYNKESEAGLIFNDQTLNINWNFPFKDLIISDKDLVLPTLQNCNKVW